VRGLQGKVAVVTGGGNGIGRACCERFAEEGVDVVVVDILEEAGAATMAAIAERGGRSIFVTADAANPADNDAMVERAVDAFGGVDILVTAAGIAWRGYRSGDVAAQEAMLERGRTPAGPAERFVDTPLEDWQAVLDINLTGTLLSIQSAARRMLAQERGGAIVTIASIAAKHPEAGAVAYGVSKAGVWMLTKHAAALLAASGIRVNAVGPGFIDTNMTRIIQDVGLADAVLAQVPMRRFGRPSEIADAVAFLASDEASYVTGELLHPDGGFFTD